MPFLQEIIHKVEVAGGVRYVRIVAALLAMTAVILAYNLLAARNMSTQEGMDAAQLARNIAEGRGYTTSFVRPLSMYLVARENRREHGVPDTPALADYSRIKAGHPDISNAPVYPMILAGLMKVLPFDFEVSRSKAFWSSNNRFWRYQPDYLISWFNQLLLLGVVVITYFLARRLFDSGVALMAAALLFASEQLWRFSASGLSTLLLVLLFMGIVWLLTIIESEGREPRVPPKRVLLLAAGAGLLIGIGALTRYGFGWMIVPALVFVLAFAGAQRVVLSLILFAAFAVVVVPWIVRNYDVSGTPFGTATYSVLYGASSFTEYRLERSLDPQLQLTVRPILVKLLVNMRQILQSGFFFLGGGWVTALFLVGLLVGFRSPAIRRMRYFLVACLLTLLVVQALARTHLSETSPGLNSENYLVLTVPLIIMYAVAFFFTLLDQIQFPVRQWRFFAMGVFVALALLPMIFVLLPPRTVPLVYPPYLPPLIQQTSSWLKPNELVMSDIPWAVAWYGDRQCVWLTLNALDDPDDPDDVDHVFTINDLQKPVSAVYLSPHAMEFRLRTDIADAGQYSWGQLVLNTLVRRTKDPPPPFPLREVAPGLLPNHLFVSDWKRWEGAAGRR
jgi:hypothetical protein